MFVELMMVYNKMVVKPKKEIRSSLESVKREKGKKKWKEKGRESGPWK